MTNTDTRDATATLEQIQKLCDAGCEVVRLAVPDEKAASALKTIADRSPVPLVADIHVDYRLALAALDAGLKGPCASIPATSAAKARWTIWPRQPGPTAR